MNSMNTVTTTGLRHILLEMASHEYDIASNEAALVPYWAPQPPSVHGHRLAGHALRSAADRLLDAS